MEQSIVKIPNTSCDERIGSVFNSLFQVIARTENSRVERVLWDFSEVTFLHPFFLLPLRLYKEKSCKDITLCNVSYKVRQYFAAIHFEDFFEISADLSLEEHLRSYLTRSYLPLCRWKVTTGTKVDEVQRTLQKVIERQSGAGKAITTPLSYFLGELIDNIEQHSESQYTYVFSQYLQSERCIDLCIADEGITIYGSYIRTKKYLDQIGGNEAQALILANDGLSTKDRPAAENRGYGISGSKRMLVSGLGGAFFMLSGSAFHRHDATGAIFVNLPKTIVWNGTIILLRIPVDIPPSFNIYEYLY